MLKDVSGGQWGRPAANALASERRQRRFGSANEEARERARAGASWDGRCCRERRALDPTGFGSRQRAGRGFREAGEGPCGWEVAGETAASGAPERAERASGTRDRVQVGLGRFRSSGEGASGFRAVCLRTLELARLGAPGATCAAPSARRRSRAREPKRGWRGRGWADAQTAEGPRGSTPSVPPEPRLL